MENPRSFWFPVLMGWRSGWTVALAGAALALLPSSASADRAFALRFSTNQATALAGAANSLMSCPDVAPACAAGRAGTGGSSADDDNDFAMTYIDVDADPTTFDSSSGRADIPPGATVLFAGLYWGADRSAGSPGGRAAINAQALGTVRLRAPADTAYRTVTADTLDTIGTRYQGFADVTAIVGAAGAGEYTIANVQAGTGPDRYAGWTLAVVVSDPSQPVRAVSIFDGFQQVSTAQPNVSIPVTGFTTPATGPVRTTLGFQAYEGDRGSTGDSLRLNTTTLSSVLRPADNYFNSTIDRLAVPATDRIPFYPDTLGVDSGFASADGILANRDTSAVIRLATKASVGGESYLPGAAVFMTELFAPRVQPVKSVTDLNGGAVEPGDVLEYTVRVPNDGQDGADRVVLRDPIPDRSTFIAGSLDGGAPLTDAAGDDAGEFDAATNSVVFRVGSGASATAGGSVAPGAAATVRFRVRIDAPVPSGTSIVNTASADFFSQTLGLPLQAASAPVTTNVQTPDLTIDKSHTGVFTAGGTAVFHLAVTNAGGASTSGPVTVTDAFDGADFSVTAATGVGWTCSNGPTVTCTRADALAAGATYPPIDITATVDPGAPVNLANTASVDGGGDGDPTNNTDTDVAGVVAQANLALSKTVSPTRIAIGDTATYELVVANNGPSTATGVTLSDPLPSGADAVSVTTSRGTCDNTVACAIGTLPVGTSAVVEVTVRGASAGTASNTAHVAAAQDDPVTDDDTASAALDVVAAADLSITKVASADTVDVGAGPAPLTYTLTVHNAGPQTATAIAVDDPVPSDLTIDSATTPAGLCAVAAGAVHCDIAGLAAGADATITVATTVPDVVPGTAAESMGGRTLLNGAAVTGSPDDPDRTNNTASASTLVLPAADVEVTLGGPGDPIAPGATATLTLDVVNHGPSTAAAITATGTVPDGVSIVSVPAGCTAAGQVVTCDVGTLAPGASVQEPIVVAVSPAATPGADLPATADASARVVPDPVEASNRDTFSLTVAAVLSRAAAPPAPAPGAAAPAPVPVDCLSGVVRLVDVTAGRTRVHLAGETARAGAGQTVTLRLGARRVGTATVRRDGTFSANVPLPPRGVRASNATRYQAVLGGRRSPALKLARRMTASTLTSRAGRVTFAGRVTPPLARQARTVTLRQYRDCRGTAFTVVKRGIKVGADGRFRATVPAPRGVTVAYYRALTRVRKTSRNRTTYPTFTLLRGVAVAG